KRTEIKVEELAEAQKRTEIKVEELAEAQKRTEIKVKELAEAQKRTEIRLEELAEAQKRTEIKVEELAEAQKRTERELRLLTEEHRKTRQQLGGLSATVGYRLEDEAYKGLPPLLSRDFGLELDTPLRRRFVPDRDGALLEVNIIGTGRRDGRKVTVIGEAKSQLSKRLVNEFIKKRLSRFEGVFEEILPVLVTYMISEPDAEDYARQKGLAVYYSYEF
ncbi:MAG: chordopoxvirus fusion protein, partial [Deltaproteobacteria bacterium]